MTNTRELRRRIKSIKNTSQITKAMQMVAATKMRKAQTQAISGRPYNETLTSAIAHLIGKIDPETHLLLSGNGSKTTGVVLLSTDKGLVGALNTNLIRLMLSLHPRDVGTTEVYFTVGRKGRNFVSRSGKDLKADFENADNVTFRQARQLSKLLTESFLKAEIGEAYLFYPHFISTLKQEPRKVKLLPIEVSSLVNPLEQKSNEFIFEPNADTLLDFLLLHHLEEQIYQALLETKASEHSARRLAMQNATDNALELVEDLQLTYNQTRQEKITTELLEITTASVAMQ